MPRWLRAGAALVLIVIAIGCDDSTGPDLTPTAVSVTPALGSTIVSGDSTIFTAVVTNKQGTALAAQTVTWTSSEPRVASVSSSGVVTGARAGQATIMAAVGSLSSTPVPVIVTPGKPASLAIRTQPGGALSGVAFTSQPIIDIQDAAGNTATGATTAVTAALASGGGTLSGTATIAASAGVAMFTGLAINGLPGQRTLRFSAAGLPNVTSSEFVVGSPPPVRVEWAVSTITPPAGATMTVSSFNQNGEIAGTLTFGDSTRAFRWANGVYTILPVPAGARLVSAKAANNRGDVVGLVDRRAVAWFSGASPTFLMPTDTLSRALDVNDAGHVLLAIPSGGNSTGFDRSILAGIVMSSSPGYTWLNGELRALALLGSCNLVARLSTRGHIFAATCGLLYDSFWIAPAGSIPSLQPGCAISGRYSKGVAMNDSAEVIGVGEFFPAGGSNEYHACIWRRYAPSIDYTATVETGLSLRALNNRGHVLATTGSQLRLFAGRVELMIPATSVTVDAFVALNDRGQILVQQGSAVSLMTPIGTLP